MHLVTVLTNPRWFDVASLVNILVKLYILELVGLLVQVTIEVEVVNNAGVLLTHAIHSSLRSILSCIICLRNSQAI